MKNTLKYTLMVAALAVATSAQAGNYAGGDLLVGFMGGSSDFIYDIGSVSSLTAGETWTIGSGLGTQFGVIGAKVTSGTGYIYATSAFNDESSFDPSGAYNGASTGVKTIARDGTSSVLTAGNSRTPTSGDTTGWTYQTGQPVGTPGSSFQNSFFNPNVDSASTAYFFENNTSDGTVNAISFFTYNSASGVLTYGQSAAVPEPATYGVLAGFGLLALSLRRQFVKA